MPARRQSALNTTPNGRMCERISAKVSPASDRAVGNAAIPIRLFPPRRLSIDETYSTPVETHNPMEMHGTVAVWDGDNVTLYESSQGVVNHRTVMSEVLGVPR